MEGWERRGQGAGWARAFRGPVAHLPILLPCLGVVLLSVLHPSKAYRARRCFRFQCLILEFGRLFPTKPISSASSLAERNLSGVQTGPFKGLLPVRAAPPPPRIDLIETRPDPFSGAQGFHQCNNGPLTIRVQQPPTPRPPHPPSRRCQFIRAGMTRALQPP